MSREPGTAAHPRGPAKHTFGKPVPGAGRARVCTKCGAKENPATRDAPCKAMENASYKPTQHEYDPIR